MVKGKEGGGGGGGGGYDDDDGSVHLLCSKPN